jgi:branched-chain amino acid aminotransferase
MTLLFPDGTGIFETIRTENGKPFLLDRHLERASGSAKKLELSLPSQPEILWKVHECIRENPVQSKFGRLRVIFPGEGRVEVKHLPYEMWREPALLTIDPARIDEESPFAGIKALPYLSNLAILQRSREHGFDDAIRLNRKSEVGESAVANLLLRLDGVWITPSLNSGVLPGITRSLALQWFPIEERTIMADQLDHTDSIFLLSSLRGFQPVASLNGRSLQIETEIMQKAASMARALSVD